MSNRLAGGTTPLPCVQPANQALHLSKALMHSGNDILSLYFKGGIGG